MFKKWLAKRNAQRNLKLHKSGFAWASSELLQGASVKSIEDKIACMNNFDSSSTFDSGALAAIKAYEAVAIDNMRKDSIAYPQFLIEERLANALQNSYILTLYDNGQFIRSVTVSGFDPEQMEVDAEDICIYGNSTELGDEEFMFSELMTLVHCKNLTVRKLVTISLAPNIH